VYITDALKAIAENTGKFVKDGVVMRRRYADIVNKVPEQEETPEQQNERAKKIISNIKAKLRKEGANNGHGNESVCQADP
jgi:hypothetical protein